MVVLLPGSVAAQTQLDKDQIASLGTLEEKFFEHTYPKETDEARIERLEKFVYGESKQGADADRLASLVSVTTRQNPSGSSSSSAPSAPGDEIPVADNSASAPATGSDAGASDASNSGQDSSQSSAASQSDGTDYPSVDALEQVILGQSFRTEPIDRRLGQLEVKAFNRVSTSNDLSDRVDRLEKYVQSHYHKSISEITDPRRQLGYESPVGPSGDGDAGGGYRPPAYTYGGSSGSYGMSPGGSAAVPNDQAPPATASEAEQVDWLEAHVFGQTNQSAPLIERVQRLDTAVFPNEPQNQTVSIPMQIKVLVNAVELMHTSEPAGQQQEGYGQQQQASGQQPYGQQPAYGQNTPASFPSWPPPGQQTAYAGQTGGAQYQGAFPVQQSQTGDQTQQQEQQQQQQNKQKHGHPFLKSLAHTLMTVGTMAASTAMSSGMGMGYGGMGGMGYGGMGMGGMGYGMGGIGRMGGFGW